MIREIVISEFWKDVDELMDEYSPTTGKSTGVHMHIPTGPVSVGTMLFDKDSGNLRMFDGSTWVETVKK
jgi:hypothetical protein